MQQVDFQSESTCATRICNDQLAGLCEIGNGSDEKLSIFEHACPNVNTPSPGVSHKDYLPMDTGQRAKLFHGAMWNFRVTLDASPKACNIIGVGPASTRQATSLPTS